MIEFTNDDAVKADLAGPVEAFAFFCSVLELCQGSIESGASLSVVRRDGIDDTVALVSITLGDLPCPTLMLLELQSENVCCSYCINEGVKWAQSASAMQGPFLAHRIASRRKKMFIAKIVYKRLQRLTALGQRSPREDWAPAGSVLFPWPVRRGEVAERPPWDPEHGLGEAGLRPGDPGRWDRRRAPSHQAAGASGIPSSTDSERRMTRALTGAATEIPLVVRHSSFRE